MDNDPDNNDDDSDDDYELEDVDPSIDEQKRQQAQQQFQEASQALDVNEFYAEYEKGLELKTVLDEFNFRFQIRHIMLLTAGVAVLLSLWKIANFAGLILLALVVLGVAHYYIAQREKRHKEQIQAKRDKLVDAVRRQRAGEASDAAVDVQTTIEEIHAEAARADFKFSFSMKQVMVAMTVACLVLGISVILPVKLAAGLLGLLAVLGIVGHAIGYDFPPIVSFGWWMVMSMYVLLSVFGHFFSAA